MFDLQVHKRDKKTGKITSTNAYKLRIVDGKHEYERPVGSGLWFDAQGVLLREPAKVEPVKAQAQAKPDVDTLAKDMLKK